MGALGEESKKELDYAIITPLKRQRRYSPHHAIKEETELFMRDVMDRFGQLVAQASSASHSPTMKVPLPSIELLNRRYRRLVKIGEGSFGEVFIVYDMVAQTYLTMKRMFRLLHRSSRSLFGLHNTAFRELHLLTDLSHPNIVSLVDYHVSPDGTLIMLMPVLTYDLGYLTRHWKRVSTSVRSAGGLRMPLSVVKCLFRQLLEAVAYLHKHKVIHRDLKTSNAMVNANGILKLIDFGWARYLSAAPDGRQTGPPCPINYRPPELLLAGAHATRYQLPLDIWCCGCILFEMLSGGTLFVSGHTEAEALASIFDWLGSPSPNSTLYAKGGRHVAFMAVPRDKPNTLAARCLGLSIQPTEVAFISRMLQLEPSHRARAEELREDKWFTTAPAACQPADMELPLHNSFRWLEWKRRRLQQS